MRWVIFYVALAVTGFAVLAVVGFRLWRDVRVLGQAVSSASRRLADAAAELESAGGGPGDRRGRDAR